MVTLYVILAAILIVYQLCGGSICFLIRNTLDILISEFCLVFPVLAVAGYTLGYKWLFYPSGIISLIGMTATPIILFHRSATKAFLSIATIIACVSLTFHYVPTHNTFGTFLLASSAAFSVCEVFIIAAFRKNKIHNVW